MDEEQSVLDFFANPENLPLGLSVAEQMDKIREQMNNHFWLAFQDHIRNLIAADGSRWNTNLTEDRNSNKRLLGLSCYPAPEQHLFLRPMMEQQYIDGSWRVYTGIMWSDKPSRHHLGMESVNALRVFLNSSGYKSNDSFLGWQWTNHFPQRRDFLMQYKREPQAVLANLADSFNIFMQEKRELLEQANTELGGLRTGELADTLKELRKTLLD